MIYFDNAATTMVCPEAAEAAVKGMTECFGNPSSGHTCGRQASELLGQARQTLASCLGARASEITFTSGGSESDNWALLGAANALRHKGKHIITSAVEHDAIRRTVEELKNQGLEVTLLPPEADGSVSPEKVRAALCEDTILVSLMAVNNETGARTDIRGVSDVLKQSGSAALLHTDAVQAFGKIPLNAKTMGADLISMSAHKIHAPKGVGAMYIRDGVRLRPLIRGGGQENGLRAGTENVPGACAFAAAAAIAVREQTHTEQITAQFKRYIIDRLSRSIPDFTVIGDGIPQILCFSMPGWRSEVIMNWLDREGICVSKGSACKKGARSHVLEALGLPAKVIDGALRVSFSRFNTEEETASFCDALEEASRKILKMR